MKRKIIKINEDLCNGCGNCVTGCHEGALKIINGKAKLIRDDFCDGLGACIGECPTGALVIEEREAQDFNETEVKKHMSKNHTHFHGGHACPGSMERNLKKESSKNAHSTSDTPKIIQSELEQWPVQLHLVNPRSDFFKGKELVILSTCSPVSYPDIHWRFIKGRSVVVACPKLDHTEPYAQKLGEILKEKSIPKVISIIMEVPCCKGLSQVMLEGANLSERNDLIIEEAVISLDGNLLKVNKLN